MAIKSESRGNVGRGILACKDGSLVFKCRLSGAAKIRLPGLRWGEHIAGVKLEARDHNSRLGFKLTVGTVIISFRFAYQPAIYSIPVHRH